MKKQIPCTIHKATYLLLSCFILGGLLGFLFASFLSAEGQGTLSHFFLDYFTALQQEEPIKPTLIHTIWSNLKTPLYIFLLGFSLIGTIGVPYLILSKGFFFTFSISSLCRLLGVQGIVPAFFLFFLPTLLWVPVLFLLGIQSFRASLSLWSRGKREETYPPHYFLQASFAFLGVVGSICVDYFILPLLIQAVSPFT